MGCNLCTLQKREEHYKLLYEIAQVNGLAKVEHDEAVVEAIRRDPIVVQVLRRTPTRAAAAVVQNGTSSPQDVCVVDVCTQTDITFEHIMALAKLRPATPPVPDICPFLLSDSCHSIHTMEHEFYECPEYLSNTTADVERIVEYEYEEVELCRQNSQEKLGLTLCYRTDDEEDTGIYVSQVEPNSIAAKDGRIKEGDRILQINGCEVQDREKAVALLSSEEARSITLLVTRPEIQLDEEAGWLDDEQQELMEEILEERRKQKEHGFDRGDENQAEEGMTTDTATCSSNNQDSGFGRSTDSPEHQPLLAKLQRRSPAHCLRERWRAEHPHTKRGAVVPRENQSTRTLSTGQGHEGVGSVRNSGGGILGLENRFQQLLELKCQIRNGGECGVYSIRHSIECSLTEQGGEDADCVDDIGGGVEQELRMLNEELRSIELECQSIMQAHQLRQSHQQEHSQPSPCSPGRSTKDGHKRHSRLADIHEHPERLEADKMREKDSSSAYNTAESARSTPLGMERSPDHSLQRHISITNQKNLRLASSTPSSPIPIPKPQGTSSRSRQADPGPVISSSPDQSNPSRSESDPALPADDERCEKKGRTRESRRGLPYASSYHTTPYHGQGGSKQLQSYMQLLQQHSSVEYSQSQLSLLSVCRDPVHRNGRPGEPRLEWKVKVRADGTRYVARRPARDRILRERALRIREERSGGMTTDDDAMSEMKMGRYWSKEERKQHLARAREQRKRREFMQKSRLECLKEGPLSGAEGRKEINILELSHKKMMKKRNKKILDNWMTIQELMSHGARVPEGSKVHNAFLSVTTV
ncbi:PDZ domain-containing RING finger protein 4 [Maylandia zebra]|uniref:PDZ domain-containing RING finger protein 4 n=1 Tax=Maylandia zebra TaxID=106582 RepID=UPI000329B870|nr:PDZ domain-containing RING finger protein 4 [Maylandia zebra]XP_039891747.1 PDZ domain-containing RING finger protein 4 [Simochromis diagramma]